jgi:two-component system sensor histidine kinase AlgZ
VHPILTSRARLALYLGAWLPVTALMTAGFAAATGARLLEAAIVVFPMCLVYAFVCQSSWYLCRSLPLQQVEVVRFVGTHGLAAGLASGLWIGAGGVWSMALGLTSTFDRVGDRYLTALPILFSLGVVLFLLAVVFNYLFITFEASQRAEKKALELQVLAREAELKALRAQIDPHFLFNSLNSISAMVTTDPEGARRMCILLADFLRGCLKLGSEERISLGEEMKLTEHYLDIERVRLGSRLGLDREVHPDCEACLVPPLIMQPLVENAITHGIAPMLHGGTLRIEARKHGDILKIVLENPFEAEAVRRNGTGVGLKNVRLRLMNLFDGNARFEVREEAGRFRVELQIPCES